jgi:hypothetical protein
MWRTRYLLMKQARRAGYNWHGLRHRVHLLYIGGTFTPYLAHKGWRTPLWWLKNVPGREFPAWVKAFRDPYDERLNQHR